MSMIEQNGRLPDEPWTDQEPASPVEAPAVNPLLKVHQLLRGKYHWAIALGVFFAAGAATVAYKLPTLKPKYTSSGFVQIKPVVDTFVYKDVNDFRPNFEVLLDSQIPALTS